MRTRLIPSPLFHYTCGHSEPGIRAADGEIQPGPDGVVWLTDMQHPNRAALGLTRNYITCDRTAYRFVVPAVDGVMWWPDWLRLQGPEWRTWGRYLESAPDVRPMHWFVSEHPVRGKLEEGFHDA